MITLSFGIATWACPRITLGLSGWIRHLPIAGSSQRRGVAAALVVAQAPVFITWTILWLATWTHGMRSDPIRLAALPVIHLGIAYVLMPAHRKSFTAMAGMTAVALTLADSWSCLVLAAGVLLCGDTVAGPPVGRRRVTSLSVSKSGSDALFSFMLARRALGWRLAWAYSGPCLCLAATALYLLNNDHSPGADVAGVRLGGGFALSFFFFKLARLLSVRRPPWPWSRSLPWSSAHRCLEDGVFLGLLALPIVGTATLMRPAAGLPLLALTGYGAVRAAGALRSFSVVERGGEAGLFLVELSLAASFLALTAWTGWLLTASLLPALKSASRMERDLAVTQWIERHHLATGDSQSWSGE